EDESESVELTIQVPASLKTGNDIVLFITAYEDGNDDENCDWESNDDLDFARRAHDISISDMVLTPETVKAGQTVELEISVENVGDRDEKDIYITVKNSELLINKKSEEFTIDSYERGDDDEHTTTLTLTIPASAKAGEYELSVYVYDENGKRFTSGFETVTLTVESSGTTTTTTTTTQTTSTATITIKGVSENVEPWKAISIPVQVTNTGSTSAEYKIILTNIGDWAESTSEIDAYLLPGQTSTYYLTITPKEDAVEGKHSATINVKEGSAIVSTKTLSFTVPTEETPAITGGAVVDTGSKGVFQNIFSGTTLWIIGDLVLVVVAIFLIRMLFSKKEGTE
ncbi:putative S-layer protein, partial [Candidatus Woesearchaeota archaeon]|nr:putative S-layer protein [Candidatus Woesearchaeota archaeon]